MSRIQDILSKAERDGTARRTRSLTDEYAARPAVEESRRAPAADAVQARSVIDAPASSRTTLPPRVTRPAVEAAAQTIADLPPAMAPREPGDWVSPTAPAEPPAPRSVRAVRPEGTTPVPPAAPIVPAAGREPLAHGSTFLDPRLVAALAPMSLAAEQYRSLRTRLKRIEGTRALRTVAITSPAKGDGKSLTAANLALTMAQEVQQRVLLLDADLRRPSVHTLFGIGDSPGLGDLLMNVADLDQSLVWLPEHHLTVLPAGVPPGNPAELLGSATMRRILDTLRTRFDRIIIDVPPVAPLADLHILAPMVDGLLMIVRAAITPKPAIERALAGLDPTRVLGLVLNEAGSEGSDTYNYGGYGYTAG
jgi:capsular exopolysaccharide synthesis family protein